MVECRHCRELIRGDLEAIGSRCPRCRMPLYERPQLPRRLGSADTGKPCAVHANVQAVGQCRRCHADMCFTCRTRWYDEILCGGCVERALSSNEPAPEDTAAHGRQAILALLLGLGGWLMFLLGGIPFLISQATPNTSGTLVGSVVILASFLPALFALGQAAAAIRVRGPRLRLATSGLICAGTHLGIMVGFLLLNIWHN